MKISGPNFRDIDPIAMTERIAEDRSYSFARLAREQISIQTYGEWQEYAITLNYSADEQILRIICTCELVVPDNAEQRVWAILAMISEQCWVGHFTHWQDQRLLVYRYGLLLSGDQSITPEQIETMIDTAVRSCDLYYPCITTMVLSTCSVTEAMRFAIPNGAGSA